MSAGLGWPLIESYHLWKGKQIMKRLACRVILVGLVSHFAPSAAAQALRELEGRLDDRAAPRAAAEPGYLGMVADEVDEGGRGVQVISVNRGGPAEAAGLQPGDVITAVNRRVIVTIEDMADILGRLAAGDKVEFEITRADRRQTIAVTLARRPAEDAPFGELPPPPPGNAGLPPAPRPDNPVAARPSLGIHVLSVNEETRARYGVILRRGAVIDAVYAGSSAHRAGLPVGGVVVAVDGRRVDSPDDLVAYIRTARPDQEIEMTYYLGDELNRRNVTLGRSAVVERERPELREPPLRLPSERIFGEDRPALRKIEGVLDRFIAPPAGAVGGADVDAMHREIEMLRDQVDQLQRRLAEMESLLAKERADKE